mmetsp:Transcript_28260/g.28546  ORF Transcript_28260/g.28546 Transcript_28260/m.28546 type:complete len:280 (-) Transcript_28260:72-911(-)|eukprot:CAMPEP_0182427832 /NCGR_PEP_ID=MMETSP1167-20130531/20146_1 /TAXON_ID=2988 /ORGANISM="Mallomonas Sp, Strain CCMP3275" /LENGTH=279 /DNA_ID=CAMNT_0024610369 /DNA_START=96 /DNA_END=935 /DNA_ORIENTATION=+
MKAGAVFFAACACGTAAFRIAKQIVRPRYSSLFMSSSATLHSLFDNVNADMGLKLTDFTDVYEGRTWQVGEWSGTTEWYDEAMGSKLTGVSKNTISGPGGYTSSSLNVWMGPGLMVPHMLLTVGEEQEGSFITADYVARGAVPLGSDSTYLDTYYGQEVLQWYDSACSQPGAMHFAPPSSMSGRLLRSPVHLSLAGLSSETVTSLATEHVTRFLTWIKEGRPVEARQKGALNARDDKLRQFYYRSAVADSVTLVGPDFGPTLGACSTGPVAEAYVGGGS